MVAHAVAAAADEIFGLPVRQGSVFYLREVLGYSYAEIAEELGISEVTARVHANHARANLRKTVIETTYEHLIWSVYARADSDTGWDHGHATGGNGEGAQVQETLGHSASSVGQACDDVPGPALSADRHGVVATCLASAGRTGKRDLWIVRAGVALAQVLPRGTVGIRTGPGRGSCRGAEPGPDPLIVLPNRSSLNKLERSLLAIGLSNLLPGEASYLCEELQVRKRPGHPRRSDRMTSQVVVSAAITLINRCAAWSPLHLCRSRPLSGLVVLFRGTLRCSGGLRYTPRCPQLVCRGADHRRPPVWRMWHVPKPGLVPATSRVARSQGLRSVGKGAADVEADRCRGRVLRGLRGR
ncbi:sigma factor-like helix-turn-helix DNA-binding protein [Amycolatopsis sp. WAC 04182]|uniref:RNA polymerase sigma factor n=1 Tax=Amycolatopsis sp. WAC 04182 TaxID=2203198 RepID=UPI0013158A20